MADESVEPVGVSPSPATPTSEQGPAASGQASPYHLRLLGTPRLYREGDGASISLWRTQTALLAYLALEEVADRSRVAGLLWPDATVTAARRSLRQLLFRLRHDVAELLRREGPHLRVASESLTVDVSRFEALVEGGRPAEALELYGGEFLRGFTLPGRSAFGHWSDGQRARLAVVAAEAFRAVAERHLARGEWVRAVGVARRWSAVQPFSEVAVTSLARALAGTGDRSEAVASLRQFADRLSRELDLSPGPRLEALAERIRRRPLRAVAERGVSGPDERREAPPLLGREPQFEALTSLWREVSAGERRFAFMVGEAGIGKTRLVREFEESVRVEGGTVLEARGHVVERDVPYVVLGDLVRSGLEAPGLAGADGAALGELSRIVPELASRWEAGVGSPTDDPDVGRLRVFEALAEVLDSLAYERPVLVVLDDLPWMDGATLSAVHHAWRKLEAVPWMLVATSRVEEPGGEAGTLMRELVRRERSGRLIRLPPLDREAVRRFVRAVRLHPPAVPMEELVADLERESGGNPLYLGELLRARAEGADPVSERRSLGVLVRYRISRLEEGTRRLLEAAAVLGRGFPLPVARDAVELSVEEARRAAEEAVRRGILRQTAYRYEFAHAVTRHILYEDLLPESRRMLHERVLDGLLARLEQDDRPGLERAARLARHASEAGRDGEAFRWWLHAAERAEEVYAGETAESYLELAARHAATEAHRREVKERRADLLYRRSRFVTAAAAYRAALGHSTVGSPERLRLRIKTLDASLRSGLLGLEEVESMLPSLREDTDRTGPPYTRDLEMALARASLEEGRLEEAGAHASRAVDAAREAGEHAPLVRSLLLWARIRGLGPRPEGLLPRLEEACRVAREGGEALEIFSADTDRALELSRIGRWREALDGWARVGRAADRIGEYGSVAISSLNRADLHVRRREFAPAKRQLRRVRQITSRIEFPHLHAGTLIQRARLAWMTGRAAVARGVARRAIEYSDSEGLEVPARSGRAMLLLASLERAATGREPSTPPTATGPGTVPLPGVPRFRVSPAAEARRDGIHDELQSLLRTLEDDPHRMHSTWSDDREFVALARARARLCREVAGDLTPGPGEGALEILRGGMERTVDVYGHSVLALETAPLVARSDPARARRMAGAAARRLEALEAVPLPDQPGSEF